MLYVVFLKSLSLLIFSIFIFLILVLYLLVNICLMSTFLGTAVAQWLRCCATSRKAAGSIPDGVIGIIHCNNPSDRAMVLGSTQPLTEMGTRNISWGKAAGT